MLGRIQNTVTDPDPSVSQKPAASQDSRYEAMLDYTGRHV